MSTTRCSCSSRTTIRWGPGRSSRSPTSQTRTGWGIGAGCFQRCFVTACARAGFTPGKVSEADRAACVDLVRAGHGVALVQPTFPDTPGVCVVPLAGVPLQWAHHVGWHDEAAALPVDGIVEAAVRAHAEAVSRSSPRFLDWLAAGRA